MMVMLKYLMQKIEHTKSRSIWIKKNESFYLHAQIKLFFTKQYLKNAT